MTTSEEELAAMRADQSAEDYYDELDRIEQNTDSDDWWPSQEEVEGKDTLL